MNTHRIAARVVKLLSVSKSIPPGAPVTMTTLLSTRPLTVVPSSDLNMELASQSE
jgi:hypothetical protein